MYIGAGAVAATAAPRAIQGEAAGNVVTLQFDRQLTAAGQSGEAIPQELSRQGVTLTGLTGYRIQSVYAIGNEIRIVTDRPLTDLDAVNVRMEAGVIPPAAGQSNATLDYRVVTLQGRLALLNQLDPQRTGFGIREVVKLLAVQRPDNIVGSPGIDQEDARYLLSIMENADERRVQAAEEHLQAAAEQAERLMESAGAFSRAPEWQALASARQTAIEALNKPASEREFNQVTVRLLQAMDQLRYAHQASRELPEPLVFAAAGLIGDHHFDYQDHAALLDGQAQAEAKFVVSLQAPSGSFHDLQVGDRIIIRMGTANPVMLYTLTGADIAKLSQHDAELHIDAKAFFLDSRLVDGTIEPSLCISTAQAASQISCTSAAVPLTGSPQFVIDRSDRQPPQLSLSAAGQMLLGSSVTAESSKKGYIYLAYTQMGPGEYLERIKVEAGQPHTFTFDSSKFEAGTSLKLYAIDEAGNQSVNQEVIQLGLIVKNGASPAKLVIHDDAIYADKSMTVGELRSALSAVAGFEIEANGTVLDQSADRTPIAAGMTVRASAGAANAVYSIQPLLAVGSTDELQGELDNPAGARAFYLNTNMTDKSFILSVADNVVLASAAPIEVGLRYVAFDGGELTKAGPVTIAAYVQLTNSAEDDAALGRSLEWRTLTDRIILEGNSDMKLDGYTGELRRFGDEDQGYYASADGHAFAAEEAGLAAALQAGRVNRIYLTNDIYLSELLVFPDRTLTLAGRNRSLYVPDTAGTHYGAIEGVAIIK
ncbi:hypothetical protein [Paenibacillus sp. GCM10027626]|uniref:hypothetical protein n=1 Tax=Paenibacillus sp. GCM10027626 TaxID=3273411 RepID=UPI003643A32E